MCGFVKDSISGRSLLCSCPVPALVTSWVVGSGGRPGLAMTRPRHDGLHLQMNSSAG